MGAALNDGVVKQDVFTNAFARDIYLISVDANYSLFDGANVDDVPLGFGWAHSDLSDSEIGEALNAEVTDPSDIIAKERARRPVRRVGNFNTGIRSVFADGRNTRTPLKFGVTAGKELSLYGVNRSNQTMTAGTLIEANGVVYGRWQ